MTISGKALAAKIGATLISGVHEWSAEERADSLEKTTAADGGFAAHDHGVFELSVSMTLYLDITAGAYANVRRGTVISDLRLYLDTSATNPIFAVPTFKVDTSTVRGQIRDKFVVQVTGKASGAYTQNEPN